MQPGEVYRVRYPEGNGREQAGRRPCVLLQVDSFAVHSPLAITIPLTTKANFTRYPCVNPVPTDSQNRLTVDSYALVFQLRATDRQRVGAKHGAISPATLDEIYKALDALTGHP